MPPTSPAGALHLLRLDVRRDDDVVLARRRVRQAAAVAGFDALSQTRIATAASELIRNAHRYAGGGTLECSITRERTGQMLNVQMSDRGPGIPHLESVLTGEYRSTSGLGLGIVGARRLADEFRITAPAGGGTTVHLGKYLPTGARVFDERAVEAFAAVLASERGGDPFAEVQHQNQELLQVLDTLRERQRDIETLNERLTERGTALEAEVREAERARLAAAEANRAKSDFLAMMSHELRTPLGAILGYARLIEEEIGGPVTPEQRAYIGRIASAQHHLLGLIDDILAFAKLDSGTLPLAVARVPLDAMIGRAHGMLAPQLDARGIVYRTEPISSELAVHADPDKLLQIVVNLLTNALKFTAPGGTITVFAGCSDSGCSVSVRDTGRGIPADQLDAIFEPFIQGERATDGAATGVGLGLAISRGLARAMAGDLRVASTFGEGSTFTVTLPRA